ncbi:MAG TPA: MoaD/ThiS family protein [Acidimicrobiia bacterium]|nr:MoaD/ThiS family protein [Acidimicrobiia bacterium]
MAGGVESIDVDVSTVAELVAVIQDRFPQLAARLGEGMSVAIDGEVMSNADYEPLSADSEVYFLPPMSGGA